MKLAKKRVVNKKKPIRVQNKLPIKTTVLTMLVFLALFGVVSLIDNVYDIDLKNGASVFNGQLKGGNENLKINPLDVTFTQGNIGAMQGQVVPIDFEISNGFSTKMVKTRLTLIVEDKVIDTVEIPMQEGYIAPGQSIPLTAQFEMPKIEDIYASVVIREEVKVYEGNGDYIGTYTKEHFTNVQYLGECSYPCIPTLSSQGTPMGFVLPDLTKYGFPKEIQETLNKTVYGIPIWMLGIGAIFGVVFVPSYIKNKRLEEDPDANIPTRDLNDRRIAKKVKQMAQIISEDTESQLYIDDRIERQSNTKELKEVLILGVIMAVVLVAIFLATKYGMLPR